VSAPGWSRGQKSDQPLPESQLRPLAHPPSHPHGAGLCSVMYNDNWNQYWISLAACPPKSLIAPHKHGTQAER